MAKRAPKLHICLVCWNAALATERSATLRHAGFHVTTVTESLQGWIGYFRDLRLDAVILDLDKLPSHGREVGMALRASKSTRHLSLVFLGGEPAKVERVRSELPGATFAAWSDAASAIQAAIAAPLDRPKRPGLPMPHPQNAGNDADLARRLGIKESMPVIFWGDTAFLSASLPDLDVRSVAYAPAFSRKPPHYACLCLAAVRSAADVESVFATVAVTCAQGSSIWIIHPKQSGRSRSGFNQNDVRAIGLAHGWVDYKVCSVDGDWSGLKFARRKAGQPLKPRNMKHAAKVVAKPATSH